MVQATEKSLSYRLYVLCVLLLVCISNLATRTLPSYLVAVAVPDCEDICFGIAAAPLCGGASWDVFPSDKPPTAYEACQLCRARVVNPPPIPRPPFPYRYVPFDGYAFSDLSMMHLEKENRTGRGLDKRLPGRNLAGGAKTFLAISDKNIDPELALDMQTEELYTGLERRNAGFYNMADGSCLRNWEYGVLFGYGFASVFALGTMPAGKLCDIRPRVAILSAALMVWSVATAMEASGHSFWFQLVCRAVMGTAQAMVMPAATGLAAEYFGDRANMAVTVLSLGVYLGSAGSSISMLIARYLGWRWALLLAGLLGMLLTPVVYFTVDEPEKTEWSAPCSVDVVVTEISEKSRVARMLIMAASAKMLSTYTLAGFVPIWYARRGLIGYTNQSYAFWNVLVLTTGGILSAACGTIMNNYMSRLDAPCWIGFLGAIFSIPLLVLMLCTNQFALAMFFQFCFILVTESWFGPTVALLQVAVRRSVAMQAVAAFHVSSTMVAGFGPALLGFVDPGGRHLGTHLMWICVLANFVAAVAFMSTAREINVDPVAAGMGNKPDEIDTIARKDTRDCTGLAACWGSPYLIPQKVGTVHWGSM